MAPKAKKPRGRKKSAAAVDAAPQKRARVSSDFQASTDNDLTSSAPQGEGEMAKFYDAMEDVDGSDGEEEDGAFARNYFLAKETRGVARKSRKKISDIDLVDERELRTAFSAIAPKHENEQLALLDSYKSLYPKWNFQLRCGFGLLMYGFGSKKELLEDFSTSTLTDGGVVVINGYLPTINIKNVICTIGEVLWEQIQCANSSTRNKSKAPFNTQSVEEVVEFIEKGVDREDDTVVYVIVHNIDGPGLRERDVQQCLAMIAASPHVRFVASIDHVNAPLLWDKQMARAQFNWWWYHTPTYAPYNVEGTFMPLILASTGAVQNARTATIVLQSLTPNAQSVFRTLAEYQLAHPGEQGLPLQRLYTLCRERFLVSSQMTLNSHLTEFKDHELVRTRRGSDGQDYLCITFPSEALSKILQDMSA
eukprot:TRINITY_DN19365_c0_g1_i1.p1 TRINITY_DN19365_c0_g1~~TRINITY_DN19365_c0_g1_i1.p1  ORF type:complete len:421 (-),score=76.38 TRINITY_DN19365_c0_g1_i1:472-1734(-)